MPAFYFVYTLGMKETVNELLVELLKFPGREEGLRKVKRWGNWKPMFYRHNVFSHSKRIAYLIASIAPVLRATFGPSFDVKKCIILALVHDDPEMLTGDYQAGDKAKMTPEQLAAIDAQEREAIAQLVDRFPKTIGGYSYQELQEDVQDLKTLEARVAKYLDVIDGYAEGIHELYAGNVKFTQHIVTEFGLIELFDILNVNRRKMMMNKYPELVPLQKADVFFEMIPPLEWEKTIAGRKPHTAESVRQDVGYVQYDEWKKVILDFDDSEEIKNLYTQREFI